MLDDVAEPLALRTARKYDALVVKTSREGGCHVWLSCSCRLGQRDRHQAQRWLAARTGADISSTAGEHLGRLAGFKNWKRGGVWVNVLEASQRRQRWAPCAGDDQPLLGVEDETATRGVIDTSPSGIEWGSVCGMLKAGLPPRHAHYRLLERARRRRGQDAERYARYTVTKALARIRPTSLRM